MLANYLKLAVRHFVRHKGYSLLNVAGLAVGMACCLLIAAYVHDELQYDRMHAATDRIYRVTLQLEGFEEGANAPASLGPALAQYYPEIQSSVRVFKHWFAPLIGYGDRGFIEDRVFFADSSFLSVFSFPLVRGDRVAALRQPNSVLLTTSTALKYFGAEDPIGKQLRFNTEIELTVTGVLAEIPHTSHFHPDFVVTFATLSSVFGPQILNTYGMNAFKTYFLLTESEAAPALNTKIARFIPEQIDANRKAVLRLQPLTDIHLHSQLTGEFEANSDIRYVYILSAIAFLILIIATINYTNLAIAQSTSRAREVGIRKVIGAHRKSLFLQFIGESCIHVVAALVLSLVMAELATPLVNELFGKELSVLRFFNGWSLLLLLVLAMSLSTIAGSYPALLVSRFQPAGVLKGISGKGVSTSRMRQGLLVLQFSAAAVMAISAMVVHNQLEYVKTTKLGFQKEQVLVVRVKDGAITHTPGALRTELLRLPRVQSVAWANALPGRGHAGDRMRWEGSAEGQYFTTSVNWIDESFLATLDLQIVAGRNFSHPLDFGEEKVALINEEAVRAVGWASPQEAIGKGLFGAGTQQGTARIIGVIKDFHFESLHKKITPLVLFPQATAAYLLIRVAPGNLPHTLTELKTIWERFATEQTFAFSFLDDDFDNLYRAEERWSALIGAGALLALLTACLGLFGLASLLVEQRTKEVGIRRVLGASVAGVMLLLSKQFLKWVALANVIAWPIAYAMAKLWLQDFAYRAEPGITLFLLSALATSLIAFVTVSYQAVKTATANPVEALRYE
jgi:putative ABC transport system permease protein